MLCKQQTSRCARLFCVSPNVSPKVASWLLSGHTFALAEPFWILFGGCNMFQFSITWEWVTTYWIILGWTYTTHQLSLVGKLGTRILIQKQGPAINHLWRSLLQRVAGMQQNPPLYCGKMRCLDKSVTFLQESHDRRINVGKINTTPDHWTPVLFQSYHIE